MSDNKSMNKLEYFGTDLISAGHYFWNLEGDNMNKSDRLWTKTPFNPEDMPLPAQASHKNGFSEFYFIDGYSILAIAGSCIDKRRGCKSVFFIKNKLEKKEIIELIKSIAIANKIIDAMPFEVML